MLFSYSVLIQNENFLITKKSWHECQLYIICKNVYIEIFLFHGLFTTTILVFLSTSTKLYLVVHMHEVLYHFLVHPYLFFTKIVPVRVHIIKNCYATTHLTVLYLLLEVLLPTNIFIFNFHLVLISCIFLVSTQLSYTFIYSWTRKEMKPLRWSIRPSL